jgi:hypothetical protein
MEKSPLVEETIQLWQPRASRLLTAEDARQMAENIVGFFKTLQVWSAAAETRQIEPKADREAA